ncbi:MAG: hypothetical protein KJP00_11180 [Bacteroidia bacterium]|nr:hypothetical protein [Bacteroidia bacterium]
MSLFNQARIIIYRVNKKGLEVFLLEVPGPDAGAFWQVPEGHTIHETLAKQLPTSDFIELEPMQTAEGQVRTIAVEGDYHDIPSIRAMVKEDMRIVKRQIKTILPGLENGAYCAVKEAFKKVMPHEYAVLKELKEVVMDRNLLRNL